MKNELEKKPVGAAQSNHPYGAKEICQTVGISHRQLDYWVLIGVVTPHLERHGAKLFRRFNQRDVAVLLRIKQLIDEGVVVSRAAERVRREMGQEMTESSNGGRPATTAAPVTEQEPETDAA
ncbi:MAG TPA: MerR family transcriptional regulator [Nitrospiria bacterium]|nr:MerR family transcriptional regulator [Nitrospiria bacterium]